MKRLLLSITLLVFGLLTGFAQDAIPTAKFKSEKDLFKPKDGLHLTSFTIDAMPATTTIDQLAEFSKDNQEKITIAYTQNKNGSVSVQITVDSSLKNIHTLGKILKIMGIENIVMAKKKMTLDEFMNQYLSK
jgi:PleD family two-component response regulator